MTIGAASLSTSLNLHSIVPDRSLEFTPALEIPITAVVRWNQRTRSAATGARGSARRFTVGALAVLAATLFNGRVDAQSSAGAVDAEVSRFLSARTPSDLRFTPDGKRLAFTLTLAPKGTTNRQEIWMLDVETLRASRFTRSGKQDRSPRWSPDVKTLAFLSDREERMQIYLLPADGGEAERLTEGKNAVAAFEWSPDGKQIAFRAPDPKTADEEKKTTDKDDARVVDLDDKHDRIWVVDIASKKPRALTDPKWQVTELVWTPSGDKIYALAEAQPNATSWSYRLLSVAASAGRTIEIAAPVGPVRNLQVAPGGASLSYLAARGDGPVPHDLFLLPLERATPKNLTATLLEQPVLWHTWSKDSRVFATTAHGFETRGFRLKPDDGVEYWPEAVVNMAPQFARSESGFLAFVGQTATELPEVWLIPPGGAPLKVTSLNDLEWSEKLAGPEIIRYKSFDEAEVDAALYRPKGVGRDTPVPLIVLVHGGPTGRWSDDYNRGSSAIQLLAAHGYAVFCPNVRGSVGYGWKFLTVNRADWGGGDWKDITAGIDELVKRKIADPQRLGIMGASYGGYMAAWAVTQTTRFKAAVAIAGMSDLASEFGTESGEQAYDRWFFGVPYEAPEGFRKSSPITHIKNARTPTLILHGENDRIDPIGQAQQLHRGLKHYGVECELVIYPREGHGLVEEKHVLDYHRRYLRWFDKYLK
jgi:dipeptidyl aminopeptidase/acylaminoacyl peptidase